MHASSANQRILSQPQIAVQLGEIEIDEKRFANILFTAGYGDLRYAGFRRRDPHIPVPSTDHLTRWR
jgi:hypothetical protein